MTLEQLATYYLLICLNVKVRFCIFDEFTIKLSQRAALL